MQKEHHDINWKFVSQIDFISACSQGDILSIKAYAQAYDIILKDASFAFLKFNFRKPNLYMKDKNGFGVVEHLCLNNHLEAFEYLLFHHQLKISKSAREFIEKSEHANRFLNVIEKRKAFKLNNKKLFSLAKKADLQGFLDKVHEFEGNFDIHYQEPLDSYKTFLMRACDDNRHEKRFLFARYLLTSNEFKEHFNIHDICENQSNMLLLAIQSKNIKLVKFLLESKELIEHANIHFINKYGQCALSVACFTNQMELVRYLLSSPTLSEKAKINYTSNTGSALIYACQNENMEMVQYLVASKDLHEHADVRYQNKYGYDALDIAVKLGNKDIFDYLLAQPAMLNQTHEREVKALKAACYSEQYEFITHLIVERKMNVSYELKIWLSKYQFDDVIRMIESQALFEKMQQDMSEPEHRSKKRKI